MTDQTEKVGRNNPCPCGSGKKFKKCCAATAFGPSDRARALARLEDFASETLGDEDDLAYDELWGRWAERDDEIPDDLERMSDEVQSAWFFFDRPLPSGKLVVDLLLDDAALAAGERSYLRAMRDSSMHLWEVTDIVPGLSLTITDVIEGVSMTVRERTASRSLSRHDWIAARAVPRGASGYPEIERGVLPVPGLFHDGLRSKVLELRASFQREHQGAPLERFYKELPLLFHDMWASSILAPTVPEIHNTDGERLLITRVAYEVLDAPALAQALSACAEFEGEIGRGQRWGWSGNNVRGEPVSLGSLELCGDGLVLEANSRERAERGRALLETIAGGALRHRATTHEDITRRIGDELRRRALGGSPTDPEDAGGSDPKIPRDVAEALVLGQLARHYRGWVDESIPALDGKTPRQAATDRGLRSRLVELIHGLEGMYERALKEGQPAYDPSWMWADLGIDGSTAGHPPQLAHERIAERVPGSVEITRNVAELERATPGFRDASTVLSEEECRSHTELRRFLREREGAANDGGAVTWQASPLAPFLALMVNFELHRRKAFWVDESLAFMLAQTNLDALGRELRVPFPSFALIFTDRHVLSLGERLLSRTPDSPVAGHILEVATVYVTEHIDGEERVLAVAFAFDAMGADPPALVRYDLRLLAEAAVQDQLDDLSPRVITEPPTEDTSPVRALFTVVVNAILYATSTGVEPELRAPPAEEEDRRGRRGAPRTFTSEQVYFLPGTIDISALRQYQALERAPSGRSILRRFMVRGHWRRAARTWTDQRMRWIAPHWKGPDMAAVIERAYRLEP